MKGPTFVGDTIHVEVEVVESRESRSRPGTGLVRTRNRIVKQDGAEIAAAGFGSTWDEFRTSLGAIRRDGFIVTRNGRFSGLGNGLQLMAVVAAMQAEKNRQMMQSIELYGTEVAPLVRERLSRRDVA